MGIRWTRFFLQFCISCIYARDSVASNRFAFLAPLPNRINRIRPRAFASSILKKYAVDLEHLGEEEANKLQQLVEERSQARWEGKFAHADLLREQIQNMELPKNVEVVVSDIPRKEGGGSTWKLVRRREAQPPMEGETVLQLAHAALGLAVESSVKANIGRAHTAIGKAQDAKVDEKGSNDLESIIMQAKMRLHSTNWTDTELAGRKSADAAFWFALAGVSDTEIFLPLVDVASRELCRFGSRSSCRTKDILQMTEHFSAAGVENASDLEEVARTSLSAKGELSSCASNETLLNFHSDRSQLLIWKFSTKQKKQRAFLESALKHWQRQNDKAKQELNDVAIPSTSRAAEYQKKCYSWDRMFKDPTRPLVVDLGSGMGVSLLGLARGESQASADVLLGTNSTLSWKDCNFVGVDLGGLGIGYARGLASRWGIDDHLQFVMDSAESFMEDVHESYPGPVIACLIQFPTPYQLRQSDAECATSGNSQLPRSARDGFMVTEELLKLVYQSLSGANGRLLLQSNCEDVAVYMRDIASNHVGFCVESTDQDVLLSQSKSFPSMSKPQRVPQRTADWIAMGGERAEGHGWSKAPILHRDGATETEIACALNGTPVHRCVLQSFNR